MFKTILVAIDASAQRHAVLEHSAEIATCFSAKVHLVSVFDLTQHGQVRMVDQVTDIFEKLENESNNLLEESKQQLEKYKITPQCYLLLGAVLDQIILLSERINADLIVIGHRHLSRLRRLFESSVAQGLVARAPCSVMIVIEGREFIIEPASDT